MNQDCFDFLRGNFVEGNYTHSQVTKGELGSTVRLPTRQHYSTVLREMRSFGEGNSRRIELVNNHRYFGTPRVIDESGKSFQLYRRLLDEFDGEDEDEKIRYALIAGTLQLEAAHRSKKDNKPKLAEKQAIEATELFRRFHGVKLSSECKQKTQLRKDGNSLNQIESELVAADSKQKVMLVEKLATLSAQLRNWQKPEKEEKSKYEAWRVSRAIACDIHCRTIELALEIDRDDIARKVLLLPHFDPIKSKPRPITLTLAAFQATDCPAHDTAEEVREKQVQTRKRLNMTFESL